MSTSKYEYKNNTNLRCQVLLYSLLQFWDTCEVYKMVVQAAWIWENLPGNFFNRIAGILETKRSRYKLYFSDLRSYRKYDESGYKLEIKNNPTHSKYPQLSCVRQRLLLMFLPSTQGIPVPGKYFLSSIEIFLIISSFNSTYAFWVLVLTVELFIINSLNKKIRILNTRISGRYAPLF